MKKQTITQKRATLYREWLLATLANDERYYCSTLTMGVPDGDTQEMVVSIISIVLFNIFNIVQKDS